MLLYFISHHFHFTASTPSILPLYSQPIPTICPFFITFHSPIERLIQICPPSDKRWASCWLGKNVHVPLPNRACRANTWQPWLLLWCGSARLQTEKQLEMWEWLKHGSKVAQHVSNFEFVPNSPSLIKFRPKTWPESNPKWVVVG